MHFMCFISGFTLHYNKLIITNQLETERKTQSTKESVLSEYNYELNRSLKCIYVDTVVKENDVHVRRSISVLVGFVVSL